MFKTAVRYALVALSLAGSAILLFSCSEPEAEDNAASETLQTEYSENLSIVESQNGRRSYHFVTPLLEGYTLAREPYREFRKGIKITTYLDDSLSTVDAVLTANYAIYYPNRQLWEAKGNVVVEKSDGKTLYTQQLFWNALTKKIYSNVDSKIVQNEGRDVFIGEGFESDEEFKDWRFRRIKGRMEVDVAPTDQPDSAARERSSGSGDAVRRPASSRPAHSEAPRPAQSRPAPSETPRSAPSRPMGPSSASEVRSTEGMAPVEMQPAVIERIESVQAEPVRSIRSEAAAEPVGAVQRGAVRMDQAAD